ncbi:MAG: phenylalanine--tRNA ligase subunit beta [Candidatus Kappaea frigidicola]|nr:phenylalanine--tRNA ligase subunit beta [Candidatus Kappaea frigidicola]
MLISYNWLKDFTNIKDSPERLAHMLTMAGIEVSSLEKINDDFIFDAEITPNRPDLLCTKGIAREAACLMHSEFNDPFSFSVEDRPSGSSIDLEIRQKEVCSRYSATLIKDIQVKVSDEKITRRLSALGLRPVNSIVDITNYFLLGWGQPMHAFDYDKIEGHKIIVRYARKGEKLLALDGKEYELDETILIIADAKKPIAIAGVIGGVNTEIGLETKNVLLECASFDSIQIRKAARKLGISTDSSYRFERGVPIASVGEISLAAASFIQQKAGGKITDNIDISSLESEKITCTLRLSEIERILGIVILQDDVKRILVSLGFAIENETQGSMDVTSPYFREDAKREIDLIEEIARIYGYDKMPSTIAKVSSREISKYKSLSGIIDETTRFTIKKKICQALCACGLNEVITYSMISDKESAVFSYKSDEIVKLQKALSSQQEVMRPTLLSGLMQALSWNINRQMDDIGVFELGDVFVNQNHKFSEKLNVAFGLCGKKYISDWKHKPKEVDFYDLKGILENLFETLGIEEVKFLECKDSYFLKGERAKVSYKNKIIAKFGKLTKEVVSIYDVDKDVYVAEVYLEDILGDVCLEKKFEPIAKFPAVIRDLAVIVKTGLSTKEIIDEIKKTGKHLIKEVSLFDVYEGKQIPAGYLSLAFSIKYQAEDRTLVDEEVDEIQTQIQKVLVENLKAQIR